MSTSEAALNHAAPARATAVSPPLRLPMKIFQIGFNKCGTATIHHYLRSNGVSSVHWDGGRLARRMFANLADGHDLLAGYEAFDAFSDMEYLDANGTFLEAYKLFPYLAAQYPDAVFILNTRDREDWIRSRLRHSNVTYAARQRAYHKSKSVDELVAVWRGEWERHHRRVLQFFAGKPHRFFVCRIETDLPHLLSERLPECRFDDKNFKLYNVRDLQDRPGFLRRCINFARRNFPPLFSLGSQSDSV